MSPYLNAENLLKPETLSAATSLGPTAQKVLERWASGWAKQTKELEKAGQLLERLKYQANHESMIYGEARIGGRNSHLADHEIAQMYDVSPGP